MTRRIFLYGGVIVWTLALFIVLSDRHVTERIPALESVLVRFLVLLVINLAVGTALRPLFRRRQAAGAAG